MTKKIPSSSLPLILISFIALALIFWVSIILLSAIAPDIKLPQEVQVALYLVFPICLSLLISFTAFLYLKRDRPRGIRQGLAIAAIVIFGLWALQGLVMLTLNLMAFLFFPGQVD